MEWLKANKTSVNEMAERLPPNHLRVLCLKRRLPTIQETRGYHASRMPVLAWIFHTRSVGNRAALSRQSGFAFFHDAVAVTI
jgi:hypothetical protein